ncbi:xylulokinase [Wielerella bovis]|uniref:xylulokinase n=1 Tax=Wielerella bovis TaxID=2917790 RepID=UPI002019C3F6|nr:xylulokinase [Wielerella bovis]MCG7656431.1 xylulokinase [Wielerella bovis]MCG7658656.1 xylulokinase [Wielerella bovis]
MYLGLDYGTSEIKALLMGDNGDIIATHGLPLSIQRPFPQWSEQSADEWWRVTNDLVLQLRDKVGNFKWAQIRGIGLSGQMHGAVLLNENNDVLRPVILWNDTRSSAECAELEQAVPNLHAITGNLAMAGFTAPKLLWVRKHEPDIFAQTKTVLLPKDYIRFLLTGKKVSEMSDAAGMLWLDVAKRDWSDEVLAACGMDRSFMADLVEGSHVSGSLKADLAEKWGLSPDVIVAGGGGDNAASAVGVGAVNPNDAFISLGTSGVVFVVNENYRPAPQSAVHCFCHALPNRWHQMSVMLSAAACLSWYCKLVGVKEVELLAEIERLSDEQRAQAPIFLPYLSGERTPHNDAFATGSLHGLTHAHGRAEIGYAVLEGVSFGLADGVRVLQESGTQISECSLLGGGARSPYWAQLLADILQIQIVTHKGGETGGALGAARLAALACGGDETQICTKPEINQIFNPNKKDFLPTRYAQFRKLYSVEKANR